VLRSVVFVIGVELSPQEPNHRRGRHLRPFPPTVTLFCSASNAKVSHDGEIRGAQSDRAVEPSDAN
jgi:hypothetical protein